MARHPQSSPNSRPTGSARDSPRRSGSTPLGIKIVSVLMGLGALLGLLLGFVGLGAHPLLGVLLFTLSGGQLYVAVGLWNMRKWAYKWALALQGLGLLLDLVQWRPIAAVLSVVILAYLLDQWDADWR